MVRTYLHREKFPIETMRDRGIRLVFTGHDDKFADEQLALLDHEIRFS